ncbi:MAG TPA: glycosyltransferase family 2 protein [Candidatus Tumulicola sp.]|nr:glycosyltransferase family 2 protein [Candidatus Tumulicola sp.]
MICCIIPAYKARATICDVVRGVLPYVDKVIVVDDACPQQSGLRVEEAYSGNPSVLVFRRPKNGGVGAATKSGIRKAIELGADEIVKIDADDQMDASCIPDLARLLTANPGMALARGNRFFDPRLVGTMPKARLIGNSFLSLFAKFASGYWNILDPTNGFLAFNGSLLRAVNWARFADDYFFEISVLCEYGLKRAAIGELQMDTIYGNNPSSLSIMRVLMSFPPRLLRLALRRLAVQYFLFDVNLGSMYILFGLSLCLFGAGFLSFEWVQSILSNVPRTTGTVMLGVLPFLMGFQLLLNALLYDVQFGPKSSRELLPSKTSHSSKTIARRTLGGV